jgi:hypothetical protein
MSIISIHPILNSMLHAKKQMLNQVVEPVKCAFPYILYNNNAFFNYNYF